MMACNSKAGDTPGAPLSYINRNDADVVIFINVAPSSGGSLGEPAGRVRTAPGAE
jgi:hypothetical protein